jgi:hypothetical protein
MAEHSISSALQQLSRAVALSDQRSWMGKSMHPTGHDTKAASSRR